MTVTLDGDHDGPFNMAADAGLLEQAESGQSAGRVYGWSSVWVSLGRFQRADKALVDPTIPWVSRPTGGKAVLHGHDVTLGLAVPYGSIGADDLDCRSVTKVYRLLVPVIIGALQQCGVPAALGENTRFVSQKSVTADCFAHVAPNDIVDPRTGQKVCGCALKLGQNAVLVQASVPVRRPLIDVQRVFANPQNVSWVNLRPEEFCAALNEMLGPDGNQKKANPLE